ncbi:hypothetical protein ABI_39970 [Asticcacaulis biprosthecium C19]|uniref:Uncharacterized protein n=1 Tax=Asticcacaulis biprosthecium C19 TaxID=715226 RepID=F4QS59_9CAUL|nr:hypothetical protein ABI_39970 [Asticcacaulis biprosthecium C19]
MGRYEAIRTTAMTHVHLQNLLIGKGMPPWAAEAPTVRV